MLEKYYTDQLTAKQAKEEIQELSFYPMMFQAARVLRETGILNQVYLNRKKGITPETVANTLNLPLYGVKLLMETGLVLGVFILKENTTNVYKLTKKGIMLLLDKQTIVNINFTHDVCYKALYHLKESVEKEYPAGLKELGVNDKTIYPYLSTLNERVKKSWFDFDHYYSDEAFPDALNIVFKYNPKHILDIGGNTGKWAIKCCQFDDNVKVTIFDLPGQWNKAKENIAELGLLNRIDGIAGDVLAESITFPKSIDAIWMSQFLDCFSEKQIEHILTNIVKTMNDNALIFIQDLYWDRQEDFAAAYALMGTSLYFTAVANGNSKMYHSRDMINIVQKSGLKIIEDVDKIGNFHTIFVCQKK